MIKKIINEINKTLSLNDNIKKIKKTGFINQNISILIHYRNSFKGHFGHADICINDKVYSYGNYDEYNNCLFEAIGDGMLLIADKKQYIKFCQEYGKTIVVINIPFKAKEIECIYNNIINLKNNIIKFTKTIKKDSYLYLLKQKVTVQTYKFNNDYKTYFFIHKNCVNFIINILNLKYLNNYKIKSPGIILLESMKDINNNIFICQKY